MRRATRLAPRLLVVASIVLAAFAAVAVAQEPSITLRIDGRALGEARTDLVPGSSYAPLDVIAAGLGARLAAPVGGDTAALTLAGHVIVIDVIELGSNANRAGALRRDGVALADLAAIRGDDAIWGPVAPIVRAFGADVAFLPDERSVVVVTRRAEVLDIDLRGSGDIETLRIDLDAPVRIERFDDAALGRTELLLARARVGTARSLVGDWMRRVDVVPEGAGVRIRIDAPNADLEVIALPDGQGTDLRIRARARPEGSDRPTQRDDAPRVALDPAFEPVPPEWRDAVLSLSQAVAEGLNAQGIATEVTRTTAAPVTAERRQAAASTADLLVVIQVGELTAGEVRLWVLGEAGEEAALDMAIRRNAATALARPETPADTTDALRRELLLGLVPDLDVGRRAADALATALFQLGGFRAGSVGEAPLTALAPAAGRGVLIEVSTEDLARDGLIQALIGAIASVAQGAR